MRNIEHIKRMYEQVYNMARIPTVTTSPKDYGQYLQNKKTQKQNSMVKEKIVTELTLAIINNKPLISELRNLILSEEAKKLKQEDTPKFCNLIAFYEEAERYDEEIRRILARFGKSCDNNKANYELQYNEDNRI